MGVIKSFFYLPVRCTKRDPNFETFDHPTYFDIGDHCCIVKCLQHQNGVRLLGNYFTHFLTHYRKNSGYSPVWENGCVSWQGESVVNVWELAVFLKMLFSSLLSYSCWVFLCCHLWVARQNLLSVHECDCLLFLTKWCWCAISFSTADLCDNQCLFSTTAPVERNDAHNPIKKGWHVFTEADF